jgi:hypothetical protein
VRATTIAKALSRLPVDIYGPGWEHVRDGTERARFHPEFPAAEAPRVYADAQWVVNANPNCGSGPHERVLYGFAAKSCVVSDDNDFSRATYAALPNYRGVEWHEASLADRLAEIFHDPRPYDDGAMRPALDLVARDHDPEDFLTVLLDLAIAGRFHGAS